MPCSGRHPTEVQFNSNYAIAMGMLARIVLILLRDIRRGPLMVRRGSSIPGSHLSPFILLVDRGDCTFVQKVIKRTHSKLKMSFSFASDREYELRFSGNRGESRDRNMPTLLEAGPPKQALRDPEPNDGTWQDARNGVRSDDSESCEHLPLTEVDESTDAKRGKRKLRGIWNKRGGEENLNEVRQLAAADSRKIFFMEKRVGSVHSRGRHFCIDRNVYVFGREGERRFPSSGKFVS
jgi:hypothetical protein